MIDMKEKKENKRRINATEKYAFEALKNYTLNRNKQQVNNVKKNNKHKDVLADSNIKNEINYLKW